MKKFVSFVSALALCVMMVPQQAKAIGVSFNAQGVVNQPVGTLADGAGLGVGAMLGAKVDVAIMVATLRAGYVHNLEKNGVSSSNIPILAGLRYQLAIPGVGVFLGLEGGLNKGEHDSTVGMNAYIGGEIGPLEVTAGLNVLDIDHFGDSQALMFTVGYDLFSLP